MKLSQGIKINPENTQNEKTRNTVPENIAIVYILLLQGII